MNAPPLPPSLQAPVLVADHPGLAQILLEGLRHGIALFDRAGSLVAVNRLAIALAGIPPDSLGPGDSLAALIEAQAAAGEFGMGESGLDAAAEATRLWLLAMDRSLPHRYSRSRRDGTVVEVTSDPTPDGGFVLTFSDVTARARAEAAACDRVTALRATLDCLRQGVTVFGPDRRLVATNRQAPMVAGVPDDIAVVGAPFEVVVAAQHERGIFGSGPAAAAEAARILALDRSRPIHYQRTTPAGTVIEVISEPTPDGGFVITHTDITALATAETRARDRAALLQTMQDTMRHGIALFGPDQALIIANTLAAGLAGLEPGALRPGLTPAEIARCQFASGVFGLDGAAAGEAARVATRDRNRSHHQRRRMPDGRIVDSVSDPTPDGGFVITWTDVTALVDAEAAAERRAAALQAMIDHMRHGVELFGPDRRLLASNHLVSGLGDIPADQLRPGVSFDELVAQQVAANAVGDPALNRAYATLALAADRSRPLRYVRPTRNGRVLDVTSDPMPDGGFLVTMSDVTALARAEAEAKQRAETQAVMLDAIRHGIALYGPDHRLIAVNRHTTPGRGTAAGPVRPGFTYEQVVRHQAATGGLGPAPAAEIERLLALDRSRPHAYRRETTDGRLIDVHSDPLPDGGFAITFSDITDQVAAEAAAESRAAMLRAALETMRHGIMLFDAGGRLLASNALAGEIGGLAPEELRPGIRLEDQLRLQHARGMYGTGPDAEATLQRLIETDRRQQWRRTRQMPDGRVVEVFSDPTPEGGFVVTFTDITARARAEAAAENRAAQLRATLDNVRHGIAMYGPDRRLVLANRLAGPSHGLPDLLERIGVRFEDLVCEQRVLGLFGPDPEGARIAAEVIGLDRSKSIRYQRRLSDGRMLDIGSDPMPDGGFVVTHSDVTDLELAKAEASERAAVLQIMLDNLQHGIRYFGPDRRLIAYNTLVDHLTGSQPLAIKPGIGFEDLLMRQAGQGIFGDAEATEAAVRLGRTLCRGEPARYTRRTPDGRILEVSSNPTPNGGFIVIHSDVTDLFEAQQAASGRAALLQLMLDSMRHGIALFDGDGRLVTANALAAEFNGVPADALRPGRTAADLNAEAVASGLMSAATAAAAAAEDRGRPSRRTWRRADDRVIEVVTDPTPGGGFVATYSDITALTTAEAAARERAGVLEVMLNNTRHGICYYGPDRRIVAANALVGEFGGHPPGSVRPGRLLDDLIREQLALGAIGGDPEATARMALGMDRRRPARYVRPAADGRILEVTSDPTPDGGFVVTSADITARATAEQQAQHRAAVLQAMLDNSRQGIVLFDADGGVVAANGIAADLNGLPAAALRPGQRIRDLIHAQAAQGYFDAETIEDALALVPQDRPWPVPYTRRRMIGPDRIIEVTTDRAGEDGYIRSYRDISDEQRARLELERARDAAEAANKAKSRFLATMSHELRTPLNAVIGFSEAFMVDRDPGRGREYVQSIHEAGRHLLSLIDDILDVTRSETTGFAIIEGRVEIGALAEGAVRVMQATAATARVTLQAVLPPILPLVRADELRLRQVLLNLLANAVKFTPAGGAVTLTAAVEPAGDLVMRVSDTGIGIAAADIPRAFEAFTQLDSSLSRRFPGSGLGLYLSRALAEAQGASLSLESTPGLGTTAVLRIPKTRLLAD